MWRRVLGRRCPWIAVNGGHRGQRRCPWPLRRDWGRIRIYWRNWRISCSVAGIMSRCSGMGRMCCHWSRRRLSLLRRFLWDAWWGTRSDALTRISGMAGMGMLVSTHHRIHSVLHTWVMLRTLLWCVIRVSSSSRTGCARVSTHTGKTLTILLAGGLCTRLAWISRVWVRLRRLTTPSLLLRLIKLR